ncbi:cationic amino acid transporter 6, chloroplastic-like protein [Tanacetum coccineum]
MIRELIINGVVSIEFVRSQQNLADHLTKGLARDLVLKSAEGMGLNGLKHMYLHIIPWMCLEPAEKEDEIFTSQWELWTFSSYNIYELDMDTWLVYTKESSMLNIIMTVFHVVFFGFIIIAGICYGNTDNLIQPQGLAPYGVKGVIDGAAIVYFSYIGYDSVSTMAEEIKNPSKSLPLGIVGSVLIVSVIYCLMALSLCMMVPYNQISSSASFSVAFQSIGWKWASNIVGAGASLGIVASLLVAMLGQARYLCVIGRARLVPSWFAKVHPTTGTPQNATIFLGFCQASIALFTELSIVLEMISIGTLLVFYLVANALIYHRYAIKTNNPPLYTLIFLFVLSSASVGFSICWNFNHLQKWGLPLFGICVIATTAIFQYLMPSGGGQDRPNHEWQVPFMPWPAALSIFLNVFLMATLRKLSYERFGVWTCLVTIFYLLYGVHSTYQTEEMEREGDDVGDMRVHCPSSNGEEAKLDIQVLQ